LAQWLCLNPAIKLSTCVVGVLLDVLLQNKVVLCQSEINNKLLDLEV